MVDESTAMGFLRRSKSMPAAALPPPRPTAIGEHDLATARALFHRFEQAVGNDPAVRSAVEAIAEAGGALSMEKAIVEQMRTGDAGLDRPWRWLRALAEEAQRRGDRELVAHLALFVSMWVTQFDPNLTMADRMDMRLDSPPKDILGAILSIALVAAADLPPQFVVVDHPTGMITGTDLLQMCSVNAVSLVPEHVDPSALATARSVVG